MSLKQRFALWALGQALPEASALKPHLRAIILALIATALGGVLTALAFAALLAGLYFYMTGEGMPAGSALSITGALAFLMGIGAFAIARKAFDRGTDITSSVSLFGENSQRDILGETFNSVVNGFLEGLLDKQEILPPEKKENRPLH